MEPVEDTGDVNNLITRIVAMIVGLCFFLMFFFVPETFWDRTPHPYSKSRSFASISSLFRRPTPGRDHAASAASVGPSNSRTPVVGNSASKELGTTSLTKMGRHKKIQNVEFANNASIKSEAIDWNDPVTLEKGVQNLEKAPVLTASSTDVLSNARNSQAPGLVQIFPHESRVQDPPIKPTLDNSATPSDPDLSNKPNENEPENNEQKASRPGPVRSESAVTLPGSVGEKSSLSGVQRYTNYLRTQPPRTFKQTLRPWNGKLRHENWFLVCLRPFILFGYPAILWSTLVYSLSIGWLIVLSESISTIYRNKEGYNFSPLSTGLVYISPFIGGILGTVVAGKVSDIIVRFMSRRNDGIYEPEFRLVMAIPVAISTCIGLMGFGWSAAEKDNWIVPTVFFGVISFGCSLGSTTAITFAVDSYRQYAGEALVTLNFSKSKLLP